MFAKLDGVALYLQPLTDNKMLIINIKENESIDKALKRFKKKFEKTGVLKELRARTAFEKPSVTRRTEILKAAYRQKQFAKENY
jgi:small subunit ribosomal protein S21